MRLTLQCIGQKVIGALLYFHRLGEMKELGNSLDFEVSQEDSQTLTCSLYCKLTGTVHLIKRKTCGRAHSNPDPQVVLAILSAALLHKHRSVSEIWTEGWGTLLNATDPRPFLRKLLNSPWSPPLLPVTRMWPLPWAFMSGRKAWIVWMVPRRLTSMIRLVESRDSTSSGPIKPTPALHTAKQESQSVPGAWQSNSGITVAWSYPGYPSVSPWPSPWPQGWTAGWSHPSGGCPKCPCAGLWRSPEGVLSWPGSSLWHRLVQEPVWQGWRCKKDGSMLRRKEIWVKGGSKGEDP